MFAPCVCVHTGTRPLISVACEGPQIKHLFAVFIENAG